MDKNSLLIIIFTVVVALVVAFVLGVLLGLFKKIFAVKVDEKVQACRDALPGANCGGCGYAGCDGFAAAVAKGEAPANGCSAGGAEVAAQIGKILGQEVSVEKKVAFLACHGTKDCAKSRGKYVGINTCKAVALNSNNTKLCSFGCIGNGDCVAVCKFDALSMGEDGLPKVNYQKCVGCGACVKQCPKRLFKLVNAQTKGAVALCSSRSDNKPQIKKDCSVGCFKCGMCARKCPNQAIDVSSGLPVVDYSKCNSCGTCITACPDKVLVLMEDSLR